MRAIFLFLLLVSCSETTVNHRSKPLAVAQKPLLNLAAEIPPVAADSIRIHINRPDGNYSGWGLHFWGTAIAVPTTWQQPLAFTMVDSYGRYVDIPIKSLDSSMTFMIHKGEEKDVPAERLLANFRQAREFWLKSGRAEIWSQRPSLSPEFIFAQFASTKEVRAILSAPTAVAASALQCADHLGNSVPVQGVRVNGTEVVVQFKEPLNLEKNYSLKFGEGTQWIRLNDDMLNGDFYYSGSDLGATLLSDGATHLKLWSPPATRVEVKVYAATDSTKLLGSAPMTRGARGIFEVLLKPANFGIETLDGAFYQYQVTAYGTTQVALDPYARSMAAFSPLDADSVGKAAIISSQRAVPADFASDKFTNNSIMRNRAEMIGYETHVRDFTVDPDSGVAPEKRGTYLGFVEKIPYLEKLGISHVQLLPVQNFYTVSETDREFKGEFSTQINYNWGYDPHNYFTPEGWYSSDARNPYARVLELKTLVAALHAKKIGVIMDVVYNHAYKVDVFESVCPGCYFRTDSAGRISVASGAGPTIESRRLMVRKLIVDSLKYFVDEYHVNGFRFDLMGFLDVETIKAVRKALGDDVILHGEAWEFTDLPSGGTTKSNLPEGFEIGAFSDTTRDSFAGRMENKGFVQGVTTGNAAVRSGVMGNLRGYNADYDGNGIPNANVSQDNYDRFAHSPIENLGFLTIHDGYTLWDKINLSFRGTPDERARIARMAYAMLLTSQGRVMLHAGDEMARTKPLAKYDPYPERAHTSVEATEDPDLPGVTKFHENSFSSPDFTNMVRWGRLEKWEVAKSFSEYTRGLIGLRKANSLFLSATTDVVNSRLRFIGNQEASFPPDPADAAGYKTFADVPELRINFVNGPVSKTFYVAGEIFAVGGEKNPVEGAVPVTFDKNGLGSLAFTKAQIAKFDLGAWADSDNLNIKLLPTAGAWEFDATMYTGMGNNSIRPKYINKANTITVNLALVDHVPGAVPVVESSTIAFSLTEPAPLLGSALAPLGRFGGEQLTERKQIVVIFNAGDSFERVEIPQLKNPADWQILLDADHIEPLKGLDNTAVRIGFELARVPPKTVTVLATQ